MSIDKIVQVATMALMAKVTIIPAKEAKNRFGELLDAVQRQPVIITKKGRPVARMLAFVDKKRFEEVEDQIWGERAEKIMKNAKFLSVAATKKFLDRYRTK